MASAAQYNITINQHADFSRTFEVKKDDVVQDLTGYSFAGSLKKHHTKTADVDFVTNIVSAANGTFQVTLTDTQTADMDPGNWQYDVVMTDVNGVKTRLIEGTAHVKAGVTQ